MNQFTTMTIAALTATSLAFVGCTATQKGAVGGGAIGGALGAVVGHQSGRAGEGAAIGALAGALAGGLVGHMIEESEKKNTRVVYRDAPGQQPVPPPPPPAQVNRVEVAIDQVSVSPSRVRPGQEVELSIRYNVKLPSGVSSAKVVEHTQIEMPNDEPPRVFDRDNYSVSAGTYDLSRIVTLPNNSPAGHYRVRSRLEISAPGAGSYSDGSVGFFEVVH